MTARFFRVFAVCLFLCMFSAAQVKSEILREPGTYVFDESGSALSVSKGDEDWKLEVVVRGPDIHGSKTEQRWAPDDALVADGWFVFIESPQRIWVFDGHQGGELFTCSMFQATAASWSPEIMVDCPREVWDALPEGPRATWLSRTVLGLRSESRRGETSQK